jgi:hypothetical protein
VPYTLSTIDIPPLIAHLWRWFWQLDQARQSSGYGPQALTYADVATWAAVMDEQPRPWEVTALMTMDAARRAALQPPSAEGQDTGFRRMVPTSDWQASMEAMDRMANAREAKLSDR